MHPFMDMSPGFCFTIRFFRFCIPAKTLYQIHLLLLNDKHHQKNVSFVQTCF